MDEGENLVMQRVHIHQFHIVGQEPSRHTCALPPRVGSKNIVRESPRLVVKTTLARASQTPQPAASSEMQQWSARVALMENRTMIKNNFITASHGGRR